VECPRALRAQFRPVYFDVSMPRADTLYVEVKVKRSNRKHGNNGGYKTTEEFLPEAAA
jgi:hypothetical protein